MDNATMTEGVKTLTEIASGDNGRATVIAVASGKGGVGKTNISVNLAICLAATGKKVVILDADIGLANLDVIMGIQSKYNLGHFIRGEKSLDEICQSTDAGVDVICGGSGVDCLVGLDDFKRQRLLVEFERLGENYDVIIVDTAAGIGKSVLAFCLAADHTLLVGTPEPTAITDVYILTKAMVLKKYQGRMSLLINMADSINEGKKVYRQIAAAANQFLDVRINNAGVLVRDSRVYASVRKREPVVLAFPKSSTTRSLLKIAARISRMPVEAADGQGFFKKVVNWFF